MRSIVALCVALLLLGCVKTPEPTPPSESLALTSPAAHDAPDHAATPGGSPAKTPPKAAWPIGMHDVRASRFASDETVLTPESVKRMGVAWSFETEGAATGTPTIQDGRVFASTWKGFVYALDEETGKLLWRYQNDAQLDAPVTLDAGLAIVGDAAGKVTALNQSTGAKVWSVVVDPTPHAHLYGTLVPYEGKLFVGIASDQESKRIHGDAPLTFRGAVVALDEKTGAELWRTVLLPEGQTGAPVWSTPIVSKELGLMFFGTGNAYSAPAGNNTDSVIALKVDTGEIAWTYQATKHDVFTHLNPVSPDWDFGSTPILFGDGLVGIGSKSSVYYAFDAKTGRVVWKNGTAQQGEGIIAATAAAEGRIIVPYTALRKLTAFDEAGNALWTRPAEAAIYSAPALARGLVFVADTKGNLAALDAKTGDTLWNETMDPVFGGLSIANGKLFASSVHDGFLGAKGAVTAFTPGGKDLSGGGAKTTGNVVHLKNFDYDQRQLFVPLGTKVTWQNDDPTFHTATSADGLFDLALAEGASGSYTFEHEGRYVVYCKPHASQGADGAWSGMTMEVVVEAS